MTLGLCLLLAALGGAPFLAAIVGWKMGKELSARRKPSGGIEVPSSSGGSAVAGEHTPAALRAIDRQMRVPGR